MKLASAVLLYRQCSTINTTNANGSHLIKYINRFISYIYVCVPDLPFSGTFICTSTTYQVAQPSISVMRHR